MENKETKPTEEEIINQYGKIAEKILEVNKKYEEEKEEQMT